MGNWSLESEGGARVSVVNKTGASAFDVHLYAEGAVAVNSRRDWTTSFDEVVADGRIPFKFARAMGANQNPPRIRVEYKTSDDPDAGTRVTTLDL